MTDSDLNFLVAVIGCMLATFWVIGQIWDHAITAVAIAPEGMSLFIKTSGKS
jgi:hypothetical protein